MRDTPALVLDGVSRSWPGMPPVFSDLHLQVPRGRVTVLLGPSGCGKSTLLRCAASLDPLDAGRILVDGWPALGPSPDRQLILQDDRQLFPWLTVEKNITFPLRMMGGNQHVDAGKLLETVGLPDSGSLYPFMLSGGMRQRVVLARSLAARPRILLLDEPFAALDSRMRGHLHRVLQDILARETLTVLLVTHDAHEALVMADHLVFMDENGCIGASENNPLGENRNTESPEFFRVLNDLRRRYRSLFETVDG